MLAILHHRGNRPPSLYFITWSSHERARRPARFTTGPHRTEGLLDCMKTQYVAAYAGRRSAGRPTRQPATRPTTQQLLGEARSEALTKSPPRKQARRCGIHSE